MDKVTPLRRQYLDIKSQYPDAIVFFRLGDFYETFDEDAKTTSRELDIVLTSRPVSKGVRVPMAGIPHHAINNYLSRLIDKGYHVAICEQVSDEPEDGLVPREVVRVVTPGTVIEPDLLQHHQNNFLATAFYHDNRAGIAYVDISTGEFAAVELTGKDITNQIRSEFFRINPSEILWPESLPQIDGLPGFISTYESWHYELGRCTENLLEHFGVSTLDGFGFRGKPMAVRTAGAILAYLEDTQRQSLKLLNAVSTYTLVNGYHRPKVVEEKCLQISNGRHPVVEKLRTSERFVPNDAIMDEDEIIRIITGPNMSGKSTFLRQVALIVLMAQMGSFIPADKATIGLVDRIFTRIGAQDEIYAGQSTFMVEMIEAANILHHATSRSLLILDEIGRGTSTYDGVSIAWAMVEYIHSHPDLKSYTLFATHYHELTELAELFPGVQNYNVAVSESDGKVVFLHKIIPGGADRSYGIHVAQIAGIPKPVIQRANEILQQLEKSSGTTIEQEKTTKQQLALFPENNALIKAFDALDINSLTPIEALNLLYEWKRRYFSDD